MSQQFAVPKNENELRYIQDQLYKITKENINNNIKPGFKSLKELIFNETNIVTAIHQIKSNKGSQTSGIDKITINDILQNEYQTIIDTIINMGNNYNPNLIKRVWIDKPGKDDKRPLGIPSIIDRIVQQCIKQILEPICEAQFYNYSFGFRPMREANMAISRIEYIAYQTDCRWAIEGDIKGFFDNVDHNILIKSLWNIGIHDKRILMIIKKMLKTGILNECKVNDLGTPQGGILSPLLANIYLNKFDWYVGRQWQDKKTKIEYARSDNRIYALRHRSNLKPMYLTRYADDWVIMTNSKQNAEYIKYKMKKFLYDELKLELSEEKTKITNITKKAVKFLGFDIRLRESPIGLKGYINHTKPDEERLLIKLTKLENNINMIRKCKNKDELIKEITLINSIIIGIANYYESATMVNKVLHKYSNTIKYKCYKRLKRMGVNPRWVEANKTDNLKKVHEGYTTKIPTIEYNGMLIGITDLSFVTWENAKQKNQLETPYSEEGRTLYYIRTTKSRNLARVGLELNTEYLKWIMLKNSRIYNFEYFMNREYAFNRDKGKCKICGTYLNSNNVHIHHIQNNLPLNKINKVVNLASLCLGCHKLVHSNSENETNLDEAIWKKILRYRNRLSK